MTRDTKSCRCGRSLEAHYVTFIGKSGRPLKFTRRVFTAPSVHIGCQATEITLPDGRRAYLPDGTEQTAGWTLADAKLLARDLLVLRTVQTVRADILQEVAA